MAKTAKPSKTEASSREAFLATAAELFRRQGYAATGLNQIVAEAKAPKGSLYFHFPGGKSELAAGALAHAGDALAERMEAALATLPGAGEAIAAIAGGMANELRRSNFERGCPLATVLLEQASADERIRAAGARALSRWHRAFAARLEREGLSGERAKELATVVLAAIEGGLLLARVRRDTVPLHRIGRELKRLIEREQEGRR